MISGHGGVANAGQGAAGGRHLSNKSDTNLNPGAMANVGNAPGAYGRGKRDQSENKKKRKNSEKVSQLLETH